MFGGPRRGGTSNGPMKGANIRKSVRITFEEAVHGCEKELELVLKDPCEDCHGTGAKPGTSPETCPKCGGKGQIVYTSQSFFGTVQNVQTCPTCGGSGKVVKEKCPKCAGTGYTASKKKIKVTIPAGIDNGQSIRIREKGEPGGKCIQTSGIPACRYEYPLYSFNILCDRSTWWRDQDPDSRWRCSLHDQAGNKNRNKGTFNRKRCSVIEKFTGQRRSSGYSSDPDTGSSECRSKRSSQKI